MVRGHQVNNWWVVSYPCFWLGCSAAISTWSASSQSRPSSTFTNMSTKVMITLLWSLDSARIRLSCIWISAMFLPVKVYGGCISSQCMKRAPILSNFRSISQTSNWSHRMKTMSQMYRLWLRSKETRTSLLLLTSKPMPNILRHDYSSTKTFPPSLFGRQKIESGNQGSKVLQLAACTMPILALKNTFTSILFWLQSKVLHHLRIYVVY